MEAGRANDRQVGGDHYAAEYQHWDWVEDIHLGYLEAQATRYMTRWRKKDGLQALQKTVHYLDKLLERRRNNRALVRPELTARFVRQHQGEDAMIIASIAGWTYEYDIVNSKFMVQELMRRNFHSDGTPIADSNRHGVSTSTADA